MTKKGLEYALYGITVVYSFIIAGTGMGDTGTYVDLYLIQRGGFYLGEVVLLIIGWIRCSRLYTNFDYDYFGKTEKIFDAAETCFVLIAIVTVMSIAGMVPIFVFLPKNVFEHGAANGLILSLLIVGLIFVFYLFVMQRFDMVKRKKEEIKRPLGEKTEDFFAFIHSADEKQKKTAPDDTPEDMPDVTDLLDEAVPGEEEFQRHLQQIALLNHNADPVRLWECPFCGSLNPDGSGRCEFCGGAADGKEDTDA